MTIKDVEQLLEIPRATIRFYEKEGLIIPQRESNGYRDYSNEDVERLKKIIIFRKIGLTVNDIEDMFEGAKNLSDVLTENIVNLNKQMDELQGAIRVSQRMCEDCVEIGSFDSEKYLNVIDEEEKSGHIFMDVAKDIVKVEKGVIYDWLALTNSDGETYVSPKVLARDVILFMLFSGVISCVMHGTWSVPKFFSGVIGLVWIMVVEVFISVPLYFIGKRVPWIQQHRRICLFVSCIILIVLLLVLDKVM